MEYQKKGATIVYAHSTTTCRVIESSPVTLSRFRCGTAGNRECVASVSNGTCQTNSRLVLMCYVDTAWGFIVDHIQHGALNSVINTAKGVKAVDNLQSIDPKFLQVLLHTLPCLNNPTFTARNAG